MKLYHTFVNYNFLFSYRASNIGHRLIICLVKNENDNAMWSYYKKCLHQSISGRRPVEYILFCELNNNFVFI